MRQKEIERAKSEARQIIERARTEAEQMMTELDTIRKEKNSAEFAARIQEAKSRLRSRLAAAEEAVDPVLHKIRGQYKLPRPLKEGDEVIIIDIDKKGIVLSPADSSGNVMVQAGIIKTRVGIDNLRLVESNVGSVNRTAPPVGTVKGESSRAVRSVKTELDLRGMLTDEGILELDRFIDQALMSGIGQITVIHGKAQARCGRRYTST